ncbi:MAG: peptidoglycan-binding protein [Parcubacteria group bacterium]
MSLDHRTIRSQVFEGFKRKFGREATLQEAQFLHAVGMLETSCGTGWKGVGAGSFNMGAITAGPAWKGATFEYRDSYPDENGVDHWYTTKFRKYASAVEGWEDLANIMYEDRPTVLKAATAGDAYGVSSALYETKYYAGRGKTAKERIAGHHAAVARSLITICKALGEPLPSGEELPRRTLRRGDTGEEVKVLQRWFGLVVDGIFGPVLDEAVKDFQTDAKLKADGIVGNLTWDALEAKFEAKDAETSDILAELIGRAGELQTRLGEFIAASQKVKPE